jgi:hypothetical protein
MSLPNSAPNRNSGKNCAMNRAALTMNVWGPMREQRFAGKGRGQQRRHRREQQHTPTPERQPNQQRQAKYNTEETHGSENPH